jgi:hypothetical protein
MKSEKLNTDNWQRVVRAAVDELPPDLRESVGYSLPDGRRVVLSVAGEPVDPADSEASVTRVRLTYSPTM